VGLVAAYSGGRIEALLMRIVDLQLSMPAILLALVLVAMLGQGVPQIILALVVAQYAYFARTTHGAATVERGKDYIEAARSTPLPTRRILFRHLLPNVLPPLIVVATVQVASADRAGGDAVLSGRRVAADRTLAGLADFQRVQVYPIPTATGCRSFRALR